MVLRGDWVDLLDFDRALSEVAAALARTGVTESLDVRRTLAVGVLADPAAALALLTADPAPRPRKHLVLYVHLSEAESASLHGLDPVGHDACGRPVLEQLIRQWCGRTDTHLSIRPVIETDPLGHDTHPQHPQPGAPDDYVASETLKETVDLRDRTCVFAWCTRPAHRCDHDHITPHAQGGPTCQCNLAPLCRHHHRLKTHAGWTYTPLEPGTYLWREPHGQQFLRTHTGTLDVTPPDVFNRHRSRGP